MRRKTKSHLKLQRKCCEVGQARPPPRASRPSLGRRSGWAEGWIITAGCDEAQKSFEKTNVKRSRNLDVGMLMIVVEDVEDAWGRSQRGGEWGGTEATK